jgi:FkbM family methyltransferase
MKPIKLIQKCLKSFGYEVVPYPPSDWVRSRNALRNLLTTFSIDCVFDVGANCGGYGNHLRDIGYKGWILSFEPVHATFLELEKQAASRPPWRIFPFALGATDGQTQININQCDLMTSFLTPVGPSKELPFNRTVGSETVELRRLDSIFTTCMEGISARNLYLKIDTQGFDIEVLRGAEGVLANFRAAQTELSFVPVYEGMPRYDQALKEFESRGFGVVDFLPVTRTEDDLRVIEMDCLLARIPQTAANSV